MNFHSWATKSQPMDSSRMNPKLRQSPVCLYQLIKRLFSDFLGMCNFLAQYIPHLSEACAPLQEISNSTSKFSWANKQQAAFTDIKKKVTNVCALQYFDLGAPVTLQVDASDDAIGATLLQKNHPVAYSSTTLTESEKDNYICPDRKRMPCNRPCNDKVGPVAMWSPPHCRIILTTNHSKQYSSIPSLMHQNVLQKIMLPLQRYTFTIVYRKGTAMWLADTLSRTLLPRKQVQVDSFEVFVTENIQITSKPK